MSKSFSEFGVAPTKPTKPIKSKDCGVTQLETASGVWVEVQYEDGNHFKQYKSNLKWCGLPLVTIAWGIDPDTRRRAVAEGIIAIGPSARGVLAIGQLANGHFAIGQLAIGRIAAIGQLAIAPLAVGQLALGVAVVAQVGAAALGIFQMGAVAIDGIGMNLIRLFG